MRKDRRTGGGSSLYLLLRKERRRKTHIHLKQGKVGNFQRINYNRTKELELLSLKLPLGKRP